MLCGRFGGLAVQRGLGELFKLVECASVEVEERRARRGMCVETCKAGRCSWLKESRRLDGRKLSESSPHGGEGQWRVVVD